MSATTIALAILLLGLLAVVGTAIRSTWSVTQKLFLPVSLIAGFLALLLGPDVLGLLGEAIGNERLAEGGLFGTEILSVWSSLPGLMISVVFAALFLGERIPSPKTAVKLLGPQLSLGVTFASGQYVVAILLTVALLIPLFGVGPEFAALLEIGFEGGHGTAAGMAPVFEEMGWADGGHLALAMATVGIVSGVIIGVIATNWAARRGHSVTLDATKKIDKWEARGLYTDENREIAGYQTTRTASVETMTFHVGILAIAILIGQAMLWFIQWIEQVLWADTIEVLAYVPLFPMAMLGGVIVQLFLDKFDKIGLVDRGIMERIQGWALDVLIIAALATLSLDAIANNFWPFVILAVVGILWNTFVFLYLAPRFMRSYWFERAVADFGQSMGVTATGLMLLRMVDPDAKSPAYQAFGYKQLVFEPFFGGGLITAAATPLLFQTGPWPLFIVMAILLVLAVGSGLFYFGRSDKFDIEGGFSPFRLKKMGQITA